MRRDRYYSFNEKSQRKNTKTPQGLILEQRLRHLASFRFLLAPFGSCWVLFLIYLETFSIKILSAPMSAKNLQDKLRGPSPKGSLSLEHPPLAARTLINI